MTERDVSAKSYQVADLVERFLQVVLSGHLTAHAALDHPFTAEYRNFLHYSKGNSLFDFRWQQEIRTVDHAQRSAYNHGGSK